jgi:hypothetical protein
MISIIKYVTMIESWLTCWSLFGHCRKAAVPACIDDAGQHVQETKKNSVVSIVSMYASSRATRSGAAQSSQGIGYSDATCVCLPMCKGEPGEKAVIHAT